MEKTLKVSIRKTKNQAFQDIRQVRIDEVIKKLDMKINGDSQEFPAETQNMSGLIEYLTGKSKSRQASPQLEKQQQQIGEQDEVQQPDNLKQDIKKFRMKRIKRMRTKKNLDKKPVEREVVQEKKPGLPRFHLRKTLSLVNVEAAEIIIKDTNQQVKDVIKEDTKENKDTSVASTALTRSNTVSSIATIQLGTGISLAPIKKGSKTKAV